MTSDCTVWSRKNMHLGHQQKTEIWPVVNVISSPKSLFFGLCFVLQIDKRTSWAHQGWGKTLKGISESDVIRAVWATKSLICWWSVFQLERAVQAFPSTPRNFIPVFIVTYLLWLCFPARRRYEKWKFHGMFSLRSRVHSHRDIKERGRVVHSFQVIFLKYLARSL